MIDQIDKYKKSLKLSIGWIKKSVDSRTGGSRAHRYLGGAWGKPYPATTGYIIPTLLEYHTNYLDDEVKEIALKMGDWLIGLQYPDGSFPGGQINSLKPSGYIPSVFNTAQIIDGLVALYKHTGELKWKNSAVSAANWLAAGVDDGGCWNIGNYKSGFNPSYYTQVVWPMLQAWQLCNDESVLLKSKLVIERIIGLKNDFGVIEDWGFKKGEEAFTHTIAYTIRGIQESSKILCEEKRLYNILNESLEKIIRKVELTNGKLPGLYNSRFKKAGTFSCLTGNSQLAICLMEYYEFDGDIRILNPVFKLIDYVMSRQRRFLNIGGIPGSYPIWGKYMIFRFPNWAVKYHAESLMRAINITEKLGGK